MNFPRMEKLCSETLELGQAITSIDNGLSVWPNGYGHCLLGEGMRVRLPGRRIDSAFPPCEVGKMKSRQYPEENCCRGLRNTEGPRLSHRNETCRWQLSLCDPIYMYTCLSLCECRHKAPLETQIAFTSLWSIVQPEKNNREIKKNV